jgi:hypothetical protein
LSWDKEDGFGTVTVTTTPITIAATCGDGNYYTKEYGTNNRKRMYGIYYTSSTQESTICGNGNARVVLPPSSETKEKSRSESSLRYKIQYMFLVMQTCVNQ